MSDTQDAPPPEVGEADEPRGQGPELVEPEKGPGSRARRIAFFAIWGAAGLFIVLVFRGVLLPFLLAVVLAYVLAPVVRLMERHRFRGRALPRWVHVVLLYLALLGTLAAFGVFGAPRLAAEVQKLAREVPGAINRARDEWLPAVEARIREAMAPYDRTSATEAATTSDREPKPPPTPSERAIRVVPSADGYEIHLPEGGLVVREDGEGLRITPAPSAPEEEDLTEALTDSLTAMSNSSREQAVAMLRTAQTVVRAVVRGVFTFFIVLMLSAYLLITQAQIFAFARSLVRPSRLARFDDLLHRMDRGLAGVVRGQLLICVVNGVLSGIGFYALDLRYWPILTLVATVLSIIPIFGAILSSVPAVIIGLQQGIGTALLVFAWIVVIHQIEANLLNPKIMGDAAKVHPVLVVFALLAGEHLFGIAGALLAVPVLSILQSLFLHYREVALGVARAADASVPAVE